jgi:hypothetical protein
VWIRQADPQQEPPTRSLAELLRRVYETGPDVDFTPAAIDKNDMEVTGDRYDVKYHPRSAVVPPPPVVFDGDMDIEPPEPATVAIPVLAAVSVYRASVSLWD